MTGLARRFGATGRGILVWTIFGPEMFMRLNGIGFETQVL